MVTYNARILYHNVDESCFSVSKEGFDAVKDATVWLAREMGCIMCRWAEINPDGLTISGEVFNDYENFSDIFELKCG